MGPCGGKEPGGAVGPGRGAGLGGGAAHLQVLVLLFQLLVAEARAQLQGGHDGQTLGWQPCWALPLCSAPYGPGLALPVKGTHRTGGFGRQALH